MNIMTVGSGFIADHLPYPRIPGYIDLDWQKTRDLFATHRPQVLINCIGKTGRPNIDSLEKQQSSTAQANISIPLLLADLCEKFDTHLIHIGSGCIYFGESPNGYWYPPLPGPDDFSTDSNVIDKCKWLDTGWKETNFANPQYSCDLALSQMNHVSTLRIRMPVSDKNVPRNLINKLRGYPQIIDIPNSMTFMDDLARCVDWFAYHRPAGIFHVVNPEPITAVQIMNEYKRYVPEHQFEIINEQQLDQLTLAKRSNCVLNTDKLQKAGFQMTNSEEALIKTMYNYMEKQNVK